MSAKGDDKVDDCSSFEHAVIMTGKNKAPEKHDEEDTTTVSTVEGSMGADDPTPPPVSAYSKSTTTSRWKKFQQVHSASAAMAKKTIIPKIKNLYKTKVLPIEHQYHLYSFCLPGSEEIQDAEFDARPMVLILGPYSTGKTSFIRHLLGGDFPGIHIGPEPTTDKFLALVHGAGDEDENDTEEKDPVDSKEASSHVVKDLVKGGKIVKGNTLTVTPELPFASLTSFGSAFLNHFNGSVCSAPLLQNLTIIDTPGVLSGAKQRIHRQYDFAEAAKWFADRSDLILLLFDAHKLDISDELKEVVETIRPHNDDKIRCILNKADGVEREELVRVYGSLMWNMGKLFNSPEVVRVYTGSFWDEEFLHSDFSDMFEKDERQLMHELINLPSTSAERKVNALVKRIRLVKVHICVLGYLSSQMPRWYGQRSARANLIAILDQVFVQVQNKYGLSPGDMPDVDEFRYCLEAFDDFTIFPVPDRRTLRQLDELISRDIPSIMKGSGGVTNTDDLAQQQLTAKKGTKSRSMSMAAEEDQEAKKDTSSSKMSILRLVLMVVLILGGALAFALWFEIIPKDAIPISMEQLVDACTLA